MKTMKWLLLREYWEHKGAFLWAPLAVALVMLTFVGGTVAYALATHSVTTTGFFNGQTLQSGGLDHAMPLAVQIQMTGMLANTYLAAAVPLLTILPVVVFFYCLAALYDDRRDRSILFWKSLPLSDHMTVLSKVLTAVVVAPLLTLAIGTVASLVMILIGLAAAGLNGLHLFRLMLVNPDFWLAPLRLVGLMPVYLLWALPTVGWLLMVSAWARSKVFLWAVGVPLLSVVLVKWANFILVEYLDGGLDVHWFVINVVVRGLGGLVPGIWLPFSLKSPQSLMANAQHMVSPANIFNESWMTLTQPDVWVGALVGGAMIFVAMRLRRWRDEA